MLSINFAPMLTDRGEHFVPKRVTLESGTRLDKRVRPRGIPLLLRRLFEGRGFGWLTGFHDGRKYTIGIIQKFNGYAAPFSAAQARSNPHYLRTCLAQNFQPLRHCFQDAQEIGDRFGGKHSIFDAGFQQI